MRSRNNSAEHHAISYDGQVMAPRNDRQPTARALGYQALVYTDDTDHEQPEYGSLEPGHQNRSAGKVTQFFMTTDSCGPTSVVDRERSGQQTRLRPSFSTGCVSQPRSKGAISSVAKPTTARTGYPFGRRELRSARS